MRRPIILLGLCSALDEISTFTILSRGGVELNPRVAWLISINPMLYPIFDLALFLLAWAVDEQLLKRKVDLWLLWTVTWIARLLCVAWSLK